MLVVMVLWIPGKNTTVAEFVVATAVLASWKLEKLHENQGKVSDEECYQLDELKKILQTFEMFV